jgi:hypothetical protein
VGHIDIWPMERRSVLAFTSADRLAAAGSDLGRAQRAPLEKLAGGPFDEIPESGDFIIRHDLQPFEIGANG